MINVACPRVMLPTTEVPKSCGPPLSIFPWEIAAAHMRKAQSEKELGLIFCLFVCLNFFLTGEV